MCRPSRKFPPHTRKTSGTQGSRKLSQTTFPSSTLENISSSKPLLLLRFTLKFKLNWTGTFLKNHQRFIFSRFTTKRIINRTRSLRWVTLTARAGLVTRWQRERGRKRFNEHHERFLGNGLELACNRGLRGKIVWYLSFLLGWTLTAGLFQFTTEKRVV